ncbi:tyrosine-type recombinase/integrase [Pseudomonas abyssi]|uniref:tyrosine-type recombinase/integrase n=1 Tax=Pseudomonas abyssi TaxID=170540 RepID=UPI0038B3D787
MITFSGTKIGKVSSVPISADLQTLLLKHWRQHGPFTPAITSFRRALARTTIKLPKGQAAHVLRHTLASHFMQNGGNILTLQKILGHSTVVVTVRYAHLAPEYRATLFATALYLLRKRNSATFESKCHQSLRRVLRLELNS